LKNQEKSNITIFGNTFQIISQNETQTLIMMPCDNSVINKHGNVFSLEGPYILNCNESRIFSYIDKVTPGKCKTDYVMQELRSINLMFNIPSCSTIVVLPTKEVILITNYCSVIKSIKNMKT
jgi:hypothetical protein